MAILHKTIQSLPDIKIKGHFQAPITGVSIDTRCLNAGDLFVAFVGTQVDGHDFIPKAISRGASAVMASTFWDGCESWDARIPLIMTEDPVKALADLATAHRKQFEIPVIAITGTNGKTSTKNLLIHILSAQRKVLGTKGNLNNHIGLPMTILTLDSSHELAIIEMGASQAGDIEYLCRIAQPTQGLITNISLAHTEFFHDVETIQQTKGELFTYLEAQAGRAFVNIDDARVKQLGLECSNPIRFGFTEQHKHGFSLTGPTSEGHYTLNVDRHSMALNQPGKAYAMNAMAASVLALENGVHFDELERALQIYPGETGRMQEVLIGGVRFYNDAYNANPASVRAGIETITAIPTEGRKIIVFGDMLELGLQSTQLHCQAVDQMVQAGFDHILLFGPETRACADFLDSVNFKSYFHSTQKSPAHQHLLALVQPGDLVYLKGSRGMTLETFINAYKELT